MDSILATEDPALAAADVKATAFETALDLSELHAAKSDSLLRVAVKSDAEERIGVDGWSSCHAFLGAPSLLTWRPHGYCGG